MDRGCRCQDRLHRAGQPPWENGYIESFNARLRDELLNGEIFYTLREAQIVNMFRRTGSASAQPPSFISIRRAIPMGAHRWKARNG
jgi:transposase InsO family protein